MGTGTVNVPVLGIFIFWVVSEPVSEKFGTEKSPGTGRGKFWYQKKYQNWSRKKFGTEKSPGTGLRKFWYRKKVSFRFWVSSHTDLKAPLSVV